MKPNSTTDGNGAEIANSIGANLFINMTNIKGLYDKDPIKYKNVYIVNANQNFEGQLKDISLVCDKINKILVRSIINNVIFPI